MKFSLLAGSLLIFFFTHAQTAKHISIKTTRPSVNLFLHLDRSIYQPQETIWFTSYILNRDEEVMKEQNTLYVVLVDPVNKSVVAKQRFLIKNGFGKGFLTLADSITAGDYWFLGYTNALLETGDQPVFRQLITVRTGEPAPFRILSAGLEPGADSLRVRYKIGTVYGGLASGAKISYTLSDSTKTINTGEIIADAYGGAVITAGAIQDAGKYRDISMTVTRGDLSKKFFLPVYTGQPASSATLEKPSIDQSPKVTIELDSSQYHQRSKVTLKIHLRDNDGNPVLGTVSLAVAASKRMATSQTRSIILHDQFPESNPASPDVIQTLQSLAGDMPVYGYVSFDDYSKIKRPINLALMGNAFASLQTDSRGEFELPYNAMVTPVGGINYLSVADNSPDHYKITVFSRADTFDRQLAAIHYPLGGTAERNAESEPEELVFQGSTRTLRTVVVKKMLTNELNTTNGEYDSKNCNDDYVCTHHHGGTQLPDWLNCPYVDDFKCAKVKPKEGGFYGYVPKENKYEKYGGVRHLTYHCAAPAIPPFMKALDPIWEPKPFPPPCTGDSNIMGSGLQSTIFWNHALTTDSLGNISLTFYTNDLTGNFTCLLQGLSSGGVIAGQGSFKVVQQNPAREAYANSTTPTENTGGDY